MLSEINIQNFKSLSNLGELDIKPITVLCGANSCGKSSILKSLLLVKQTIDNDSINRNIILNGPYVRLGDYKNVVFKNDVTKDITIELSFSLNNGAIRMRENRFIINRLLRSIGNEVLRGGCLRYRITFGNEGSITGTSIEETNNITKSLKIKKFAASILNNENKLINEVNIQLNEKKNKYRISFSNLSNRMVSSIRDEKDKLYSGEFESNNLEFIGFIPDAMSLYEQENNEQQARGIQATISYLQNMTSILKKMISNFSYIGPLREEPARRYVYENIISNIGVKGENAPYLYMLEASNKIGPHFFFDIEEEKFLLSEDSLLKEALSRWMDIMNIENFKVQYDGDIFKLSINDTNHTGTQVNIADVGFGFSQVFPILLEGLRMPKEGRLLLEQPEIHLHPSLQMKLADYFISLALSGKNVIVETHSDHMINRLVRRIIESDDNRLLNLIRIYFITPGDNGAKIEEVQIDDARGIVNWPEGFFDQNASEQELIIRAGLNKRKKKRSELNGEK